jgi:hypothetical protein
MMASAQVSRYLRGRRFRSEIATSGKRLEDGVEVGGG